ncbi:MAG: AAA family ATPase [Armatimonadetes bacterium]|nr:AAA family ATPase [Armatimonadota bacterium]
MITRLVLENYKSVERMEYDLTAFDLLVGGNNSGKSTVLQALAIWQYCVDEFGRSRRAGTKGIQVVLPNFTAVPVPEFNLLWKDRTDRHWPVVDGVRKQAYILIHIGVQWSRSEGRVGRFGVNLRYQSPQTLYAIPEGGWSAFREAEEAGDLPRIAYVPPFSGLEPTEAWLDDPLIRRQVGKGQPGSVLRNLLLRVWSPDRPTDAGTTSRRSLPPRDWSDLAEAADRWFSVDIQRPKYDPAKDVSILAEYTQNGKRYDIISGGSGFHQTLTLLAFLYGYHPTTILLDEPDAHLHVNLQRQVLDFFRRQSRSRDIQFLIATHAEAFIRDVAPDEIVSLLSHVPTRPRATPSVLDAMAVVTNEEVAHLLQNPYVLYVEGESDGRVLRSWAKQLDADDAMARILIRPMGGGEKTRMKDEAERHFLAARQIVPDARRLVLLDHDHDGTFHPAIDNPVIMEWGRRNIENYLLMPDVWRRVVQRRLGDLLARPALEEMDRWFGSENLTLPPGADWRTVSANVFSVVDGKRLLYSGPTSLFQRLQELDDSIRATREEVAAEMMPDEIHDDIRHVFSRIVAMVRSSTPSEPEAG